MGENVADSFTHRVGKKAVGQIRAWRQSQSRQGGQSADDGLPPAVGTKAQ